jgi:hypothetical protein
MNDNGSYSCIGYMASDSEPVPRSPFAKIILVVTRELFNFT